MIPSRRGGHSAVCSASVAEPTVCDHAARCAGCPLIGLPYAEQLERKQARARAALAPYPALTALELPAPVGADTTEAYRVRAKLVVAPHDRIGLYAGPAHEVVDIPSCRVLSPALLATSEVLRALLRSPPTAAGSALVAFAGD